MGRGCSLCLWGPQGTQGHRGSLSHQGHQAPRPPAPGPPGAVVAPVPLGPPGPQGEPDDFVLSDPRGSQGPQGHLRPWGPCTKRDTFDFMRMCFTVKVSHIAQLLWGPPRTYRAPRGTGGL